jgi:hypothetical protein
MLGLKTIIPHLKKNHIRFQTRNKPSFDLKVGLTKLSTACYVTRFIKSLMSHNTLVLVYYSLFHIAMSYGIIFWGNSCHSIKVIRMPTRVITIIIG